MAPEDHPPHPRPRCSVGGQRGSLPEWVISPSVRGALPIGVSPRHGLRGVGIWAASWHFLESIPYFQPKVTFPISLFPQWWPHFLVLVGEGGGRGGSVCLVGNTGHRGAGAVSRCPMSSRDGSDPGPGTRVLAPHQGDATRQHLPLSWGHGALMAHAAGGTPSSKAQGDPP